MFGSHLSIAGGMHLALLAAESYGMQTVQVFTKNQQQWAAKPLDPAVIRDFRLHADRLNFTQIVAHDSYLINLGAKDDTLWEKSVAAFAHELERCDQLGIACLVTHPGAHVGHGEQFGIERVAQALDRILTQQPTGRVTICLETTAGQGSSLGWRFEHLAELRRRSQHPHRLAICVDTCHILAAGYDITTESATRTTLDQLDRIIGLNLIKVWHLNDSKKPLASRVDRHEHIGRGHIGLDAFRVICTQFPNTPKILETPKEKAPDGKDWDTHNLNILRNLSLGKTVRLKKFPTAPKPPTRPTKSPPPKPRPKSHGNPPSKLR